MKIRILILTLCAAALFTACGGNSSAPMKMAEEFATAYLNADYDKCNKMMEEEEFNPSSEMSSMEKAVVKAMKEEALKMKYILTIDGQDTDIGEESADVYFNVSSGKDPGFKETFRICLRKNDNDKWVVNTYRMF